MGLPSKALLELQRAVYARDWDRVGAHALHHLAAGGSAAEVELVSELRGCSPNHQDHEGRTPLHHAMVAGNTATVVALLALGANPHVRDDLGRDPLEELELGWAECYMQVSEQAGKVLEPVKG